MVFCFIVSIQVLEHHSKSIKIEGFCFGMRIFLICQKVVYIIHFWSHVGACFGSKHNEDTSPGNTLMRVLRDFLVIGGVYGGVNW